MRVKHYLYFSVIVLSAVAIFTSYSQIRMIDGDEGFYTSAVKLVSEGKVLYRDFFYLQGPLLPYIYSLFSLLTGHTLMAMRTLSVICGVLTVILWIIFLWKEYCHSREVVIAAIIVLVLNPYLISWSVTVKTYALCNLLITCFFISLYLAIRSGKSFWCLCAGFSLGLCASARLLYAPLAVLIALWVIVRSIKTRQGFRSLSQMAMICTGIIISSLPAIILFLKYPDAFMFNNVGYHNLRSSHPGSLFRIVHAVIYFIDTIVYSPYMILQFLLVITGVYSIFRINKNTFLEKQNIVYIKLTLGIAIVYILSSMVPIPLYRQYFTAPLTPFLFPMLTAGLLTISKKSKKLVFAICFLAFVLSGLQLYRETKEHSQEKVWQLQSYNDVSDYIKENTEPNDVVLSFWPGYVYESSRRYFPGLENHFALRISSKISDSEKEQYHIADKDKIFAAILDKTPESIIIGAWMKDFYINLNDEEIQYFKNILMANYRLAKKVGGVEIYHRRETNAFIPVINN